MLGFGEHATKSPVCYTVTENKSVTGACAAGHNNNLRSAYASQGKKAAGRLQVIASLRQDVASVLDLLGLRAHDTATVLQEMRQRALKRLCLNSSTQFSLGCFKDLHGECQIA